jgi:hypothetical protein
MHLQASVTIQPNLELKTLPKQLLGSLPLVMALPVLGQCIAHRDESICVMSPKVAKVNRGVLTCHKMENNQP